MKRICNILKMSFKFIDIGANLTDPMYSGVYGGSKKHEEDIGIVLERAWKNNVDRIIITVGTLDEAEQAANLAKRDDRLYITMGCHPTRCGEFSQKPEKYYDDLCKQVEENANKIIAIGECGLDYDRLHFCDKETQKKFFEKQLQIAAKYQLPLFLHCRNAHKDLMEILNRNRDLLESINNGNGIGVVHSFDGTLSEAESVLAFGGLYIGINGCSLKSVENIEVVKKLPNDKILLETDSPWCGIRPSHASFQYVKTKFPMVKKKDKWTADTLIDGRNEPCQIRQVLEVIAGVKEENEETLADIFYENSIQLFFGKKI